MPRLRLEGGRNQTNEIHLPPFVPGSIANAPRLAKQNQTK